MFVCVSHPSSRLMISFKMLLLADDSIVLPNSGTFPELWKHANITPIHKKAANQKVLFPIFRKIFEKNVFEHLYNYFVSNNLFTNNQSFPRLGLSSLRHKKHDFLIHLMIGVIVFVLQKIPNILYYPDKNIILQSQTY